ncbi:MAG: nucleoside:proton symporter [Gammaproteobacteria bacterium]|nr:nucleoside:proton symporter [Gammaproteobacteria bacterium]
MGLMAQSLLGVILIPLFAWMVSEDRPALRSVRTARLVAAGLGLQIALAALFIVAPGATRVFEVLSEGVAALQRATATGVQLVFGYLGGGAPPFAVENPQYAFLLAFQALPIILIMSVLSRMLYHWGVLQLLVRGFAWALRRTLGIGGPLGTATAANIFVGMVEAPLLIRPYLDTMSRGALFATMTAGMATVAGTVLALYVSILDPSIPGSAGHVLAASVMSAPAALMLARLMVPDVDTEPGDVTDPEIADPPQSTMDAVAQGTTEGLKLLAYVAAMLVVMVSLVALANMILGVLPDLFGMPLTIERMLGWICAPVAWIIGIPWGEAAKAGELIGIKVVLNELLAYLQLASTEPEALSPRSRLILLYGLCGFANLGSLGIMIGGLVAMAPGRRAEIVALGPKTILSGVLATLLTGAVVGMLTPA